MNEQEVRKAIAWLNGFDTAFQLTQDHVDAVNTLLTLAQLHIDKSPEPRIEKKDSQWQCEHIKQNIIDCYCPWCNLTIAENAVDSLRKKLKSLEPKVEEMNKDKVREAVKYFIRYFNINLGRPECIMAERLIEVAQKYLNGELVELMSEEKLVILIKNTILSRLEQESLTEKLAKALSKQKGDR